MNDNFSGNQVVMARINQTTINAYKALDILLWAQLRAPIKEQKQEQEHERFFRLDKVLQKELNRNSIAEFQKPYIEHYTLCLCQILVWQKQERTEFSSKGGQALVKNFEKENTGFNYEEIKQNIDEIELATYLAFISTAMEREGINPDTVLTITNTVLNDEELNFFNIPRVFLIDLTMQYYIFKHPKCAINLLTHFCTIGLLKNKAINPIETNKGQEILTRIGLFQEFYRSCILMEQCKLNLQKEKKTIDIEGVFDIKKQKIEFEEITLPINYFKTRPGRRALEFLSGNSLTIKPLPKTDHKNLTEVQNLLEYAVQDYELQVLMNSKSKKPYQLRKVTNITCAATFYHSLFVYIDLPLCRGENSYKYETKTTWFSKVLKEKHGITAPWKTLYNSHRDLGKSKIERLRNEWEWYLTTKSIALSTWYEAQRDLMDISGLITMCTTEEK